MIMSCELDLPAESLAIRVLDYIIGWLEYLEMKIIGDGNIAFVDNESSEIELTEIKTL